MDRALVASDRVGRDPVQGEAGFGRSSFDLTTKNHSCGSKVHRRFVALAAVKLSHVLTPCWPSLYLFDIIMTAAEKTCAQNY